MTTVKIAYNACFGGFGLSNEAIELYLKKKGYKYTKLKPKYSWGSCFDVTDPADFCDRDIERHDPILIDVIEELGELANGDCAKLAIEELDAGTQYRIDEYDGNESINTRDRYDWVTA